MGISIIANKRARVESRAYMCTGMVCAEVIGKISFGIRVASITLGMASRNMVRNGTVCRGMGVVGTDGSGMSVDIIVCIVSAVRIDIVGIVGIVSIVSAVRIDVVGIINAERKDIIGIVSSQYRTHEGS